MHITIFTLRKETLLLRLILRLTLLASDTVEAILDARHPSAMALAVLMRPFAVGWDEQEPDLVYDLI